MPLAFPQLPVRSASVPEYIPILQTCRIRTTQLVLECGARAAGHIGARLHSPVPRPQPPTRKRVE